jgi:hypothetical protein
MVSTIPDQKRTAIAEKIADMKAIQNLLIANEQQFIQECNDNEIRDRLEKMLKDDQKNLGIIETVGIQYGIQAEPEETITEMIEKVQQMMQGSELSLYKKAFQHEYSSTAK